MEPPDHHKNIITRQLPKTAQTTVRQAGDDGTYQAGWWLRRTVAANKTRFRIETISGDDVVIDRATGLMWARDSNAAGGNNGAAINWSNAIIYAEALTFAGFSDWRIPNHIEWLSICKEQGLGRRYPEFQSINGKQWTSTNHNATTAFTCNVANSTLRIIAYAKTDLYDILCVRGGV